MKTGARSNITGDYCISNIPLPLLSKIDNNFADDFNNAVALCKYDPTCKLGWQANARFWENNKNQIYGGISYTDDPITQMWYPSYDYFTKNGTLTGVYNYDQRRDQLRQHESRAAHQAGPRKARSSFIRSLPIRDSFLQTRPSRSPGRTFTNEGGGWANWDPHSDAHAKAYTRLLAPDRRFYVTGRSGFATARMAGRRDDVSATRHRNHRRAQVVDRSKHQTRTKYTAADSRSFVNFGHSFSLRPSAHLCVLCG